MRVCGAGSICQLCASKRPGTVEWLPAHGAGGCHPPLLAHPALHPPRQAHSVQDQRQALMLRTLPQQAQPAPDPSQAPMLLTPPQQAHAAPDQSRALRPLMSSSDAAHPPMASTSEADQSQALGSRCKPQHPRGYALRPALPLRLTPTELWQQHGLNTAAAACDAGFCLAARLCKHPRREGQCRRHALLPCFRPVKLWLRPECCCSPQ